MIFVVIDPSDACHFVGHFKAEVAHRMNIILGWKKRTVWCEGYDSPIILTPLRALMAISYLYGNAAKDNQEDTIDLFPGLSSWEMFQSGNHTKEWKFIRRPAFQELPIDAHNLAGYTVEAQRLVNSTKKNHTFKLEPNAWLDAFEISKPDQQQEWNKLLVTRVRALEERAREKRLREGKSVIGHRALLNEKMRIDYKPNRSGKRMWCLSEKRSVRVQFIDFLKGLLAEAREVFKRWHLGDYSVAYPAGLFPPSQPKLIEPLAAW